MACSALRPIFFHAGSKEKNRVVGDEEDEDEDSDVAETEEDSDNRGTPAPSRRSHRRRTTVSHLLPVINCQTCKFYFKVVM